jgi:glucosamine--fructose-6-phosphate aminotransferase (isomerizing)
VGDLVPQGYRLATPSPDLREDHHVPGPAPTSARPPYLQDIHAQPESLAALLAAGLSGGVRAVLDRTSDADRIVLTGMGASLFAWQPTFLRLAAAGLPVWVVETAELLGAARGLLTPGTMLWVASQSGRTAEVVALLEQRAPGPGVVLALTNEPDSPLAGAADAVLELHSGRERTVSTRSYVNTLAAAALATSHALGAPVAPAWQHAPAALADWLAGWDEHHARLDGLLPASAATLLALGRGAGLAAARTGALITKEASGMAMEAMSVPQFRHGPLEMAGPALGAMLLAGTGQDRERNAVMRRDLLGHGARVAWIDTEPDGSGVTIADLGGDLRPIAEILPFQVLSVVLAERRGREPGAFTRIGKVTEEL